MMGKILKKYFMSVFIDIKGYEGLYKINKEAVIYSYQKSWKAGNGCVHYLPEKIVSQITDKLGYNKVHLNKNGNRKSIAVHRLIALNFIANPENKKEVNHKNGIKSDNRIENLEWNTHQENIQHAHKTGLASTKAAVAKTSLKIKNNQTGEVYLSAEKAAKSMGISRRHLLNMLYGKYKNNSSFVFA